MIRSLTIFLVFGFVPVFVSGQVPDSQKKDSDKPAIPIGTKFRDLPFRNGVELQFLIRELARDMGLNVLFDIDSFRVYGRKTFIELRNVTSAEALDYLCIQEHLQFDRVGPNTILVAGRFQGTFLKPLGIGLTHVTEQLAQYFEVDYGVLINSVRDNSPASKAGLKAGDVILEIDGVPIKGTLALFQAINEKKENAAVMRFVRKGKSHSVTITPTSGAGVVPN